MKHLYCFYLLLFTSGCVTGINNCPVATYMKTHPDARDYVYIYPISLDTYFYLQGQQIAAVKRMAVDIKRYYPQPEGYDNFVKTKIQEGFKDELLNIQDYNSLNNLAENGGVICQFKWDNGYLREMGMLVIKDNKVVKRDVWVTDYINNQNEPTGQSRHN